MSAAPTPQDSFDLHVRYGEPVVERFTIRPNVTMTVEYGVDGKPCVLDIESHEPRMSLQTAQELLDEVAPPGMRGKEEDAGVGITMSANSVLLKSTTESTIAIHSLSDSVDSIQLKSKRDVCAGAPKTSSVSIATGEFRARFGRPNMERYIVRPDLMLTVEYGSDRAACQLILEAYRPLLKEPNPDKLISRDAVTEIFDQIVPSSARGAEIGPAVAVVSSAISIEGTLWKNISIMHQLYDCASLKPRCEMRATLTFERKGPLVRDSKITELRQSGFFAPDYC